MSTTPIPATGVVEGEPEQFDTTGLSQEDLAVLQNVVRTQGRQAARNLMHQWQTINGPGLAIQHFQNGDAAVAGALGGLSQQDLLTLQEYQNQAQ